MNPWNARSARLAGALLTAPLLALPASAQAEPLVLVGDVLPGIGTITNVHLSSVTDDGGWLAWAVTDNPNPNLAVVLIKDGAVYLQQGDPIAGGSGSFALVGPGLPKMNAQGDVAWARLASPAQPFSELLFNGNRVLATGDLVGAPGFSPTTRYERFYEVEINDARQLVVQVEVDDPLLLSLQHAIVRIDVDAAGVPLQQSIVLKETDKPFGGSLLATSLTPLSEAFSVNESGLVAMHVGPSDFGGVLVDEAVVGKVGTPSPVYPWTWGSMFANVDIGDGGDYAFTGRAHDRMLVWNGSLVAMSGEPLDAFAPHALQGFGPDWERRVFVAADGDVFWYADWDDPDTTRDTGVMHNLELILQEGVSLAAGSVIDELGGGGQVLEVSDNGRFLAFDALLADGREGVFLFDLEKSATPLSSCTAHLAELTVNSAPQIGVALVSTIGGEQSYPVTAYQAFATQTVVGPGGCGVAIPGAGELMIGAPFAVTPAVFTFPGALSPFSVPIPQDLTLLGATFHTQGIFVDASPTAAEPLRLSNAFTLTIGI